MPDWLQISAVTERKSAYRIWEALDLLGTVAVTLESADDVPDCDEIKPNLPKWRRQKVGVLLDIDGDVDCESVITIMRQIAGPDTPIITARVRDRNWIHHSRQSFQPFQIANKFWICPVWHPSKPSSGQTIWITPGLAFGTGKHPSTSLCLEQLLRLNLTDVTILDWGCGSGILAVVALKFGASKALGVDVDDHALAETRKHAAQNQVHDRLVACRPEEVPENFRCQLVVANLLARTLIDLAPTLSHYLTDNGRLICSGILEDQLTEVVSALGPDYRFDTVCRNGWIMIMATRQ